MTAIGPPPLWEQQSRHWARLKPPLRPPRADLARVQRLVDEWRARGGPSATALVLGTTPEFRALRWPAGAHVLAADLSPGMIHAVWSSAVREGARGYATQADWTALPLSRGSVGLALGDGCFTLVGREVGARVLSEVRRVLEPGGVFRIRIFARAGPGERPGDVWQGLLAGRFGNFHVFKFRLLMSMLDGAGNVPVAEAFRYFESRCADPEELARRLRWPVEEVLTIRAYRDQRAVYWFPTAGEFLDAVGGTFVAERTVRPRYEMGECCPTFLLRPRRDRG